MVIQQDSSYGLLIQTLKQAQSQKWMDEYLDLVKDLLEFTGLKEDDPRLSISLRRGYGIVVNINRRHVLTSFRKSNSWVRFIINPTSKEFPEMLGRSVVHGQYKSHAGETFEQTPYMVRLEGLPKDLLTTKQREAWKEAVLAELNRGKSSPYRKWHTPVAYKAVVDLEYRELVFEEAFSDSQTMQSLEGQRRFKTLKNKLPDLSTESQKIEAEGYFDSTNIEDSRQRTLASIVQRRGQSSFRQKLLIAYGGRCSITGCCVESVIEAAHIIPYQGVETNHSSNGLPLRADIHTLFDLHLLTIRPENYEIVLAPELSDTCYHQLAGQKLSLPKSQIALPDKNALRKHYETFLKKHGNHCLPPS